MTCLAATVPQSTLVTASATEGHMMDGHGWMCILIMPIISSEILPGPGQNHRPADRGRACASHTAKSLLSTGEPAAMRPSYDMVGPARGGVKHTLYTQQFSGSAGLKTNQTTKLGEHPVPACYVHWELAILQGILDTRVWLIQC